MEITAAEALVRCLEKENVEVIFGYPGGAILPVYDALYHSSRIKHVLVRHEQGAVHAADGYARVTGKVGVCMATSGPGATNLVTGIANAYMDSIPLVVFTGQVPTTQIGTDAFQEVDITGITLPITKHNYLVKDPNRLPGYRQECLSYRRDGSSRPGADRSSQGCGAIANRVQVSGQRAPSWLQADLQRPSYARSPKLPG